MCFLWKTPFMNCLTKGWLPNFNWPGNKRAVLEADLEVFIVNSAVGHLVPQKDFVRNSKHLVPIFVPGNNCSSYLNMIYIACSSLLSSCKVWCLSQLGSIHEPPASPIAASCYQSYRQTPNISCTLVANKIVDHSDVVGASPLVTAPTTCSFST